MKKFSVILVIILLFVQILPLYSFATSQDKETAPYVPSIYDVYAGELSYEEYLKLGGEPVRLEAFPTGTYYLNNKSTGRYAKNSSGSAAAQSGFLSTHGNTIQWEIAQNGNYYTIKSVSDPTKYLASGTSAGSARLLTADAGNISYCLWEMTLADGGWIIKNYQTSMYLVVYGYSLYSVNATVNPNGTDIDTYLWRGALTSIYGSTSSYVRRELDSGFTISNLNIDVGETASPTINKSPSSALWADAGDFTYSASSSGYVSVSNSAGTITGLNTGTINITATHKVTGRARTFSVTVYPGDFDLYLCADPGIIGHVWIVLKSYSCHATNVGPFSINSFDYLTIGSFGVPPGNGFGNYNGVWYNREVYSAKVKGDFLSGVSLRATISNDDIERIGFAIFNSYDDYSATNNNCAHFAVGLWNQFCPNNMLIYPTLYYPYKVAERIEGITGYLPLPNLLQMSSTTFGYFNGSGIVTYNYSNLI